MAEFTTMPDPVCRSAWWENTSPRYDKNLNKKWFTLHQIHFPVCSVQWEISVDWKAAILTPAHLSFLTLIPFYLEFSLGVHPTVELTCPMCSQVFLTLKSEDLSGDIQECNQLILKQKSNNFNLNNFSCFNDQHFIRKKVVFDKIYLKKFEMF